MSSTMIDLKSPKFQADKYGYIKQLRNKADIHPIEGGHVFLGQEDAIHIMRCREFRFSFFRINESASPYLANAIEHELLNMHADEHARLQKLVLQAMRDQIVDELKDGVATIVNELIDAFPDQGVIDFCAAFADPLPAHVLRPMFGVPYGDVDGLNDWIKIGGRKVDALQSGDGIEAVETANRSLHSYIRGLLKDRRAAPGRDVFNQLMLAEIDGERLSEDELVFLASELASAGVDTTRSQLPLILYELLTHPDQMAALRADPTLARNAVEEGMRYAPLPWALPHAATQDHDYKGMSIKEGDLAMVLIPAVNRDPAAVENPDVFDIKRRPTRNFSFGYGMHACPGAQLARLEMAAALEGLVRRLPEMRLVEEPKRDPVSKGETPTEMKIEIVKG